MPGDHGFDPRPHMVRVDFFTDDGRMKWKYTEAVSFEGLWDFMQPVQALAVAWARHGRLHTGYLAVCLEPYHRFSYPVMLNDQQRNDLLHQAGKLYHFNTTEPARRT
jgi:hypothetical protein